MPARDSEVAAGTTPPCFPDRPCCDNPAIADDLCDGSCETEHTTDNPSPEAAPLSTPPDECETCGNPDSVLCDECALEEHLGDIERAGRLRVEDVVLYSVPLRTGEIV